MGIFLRGLTSHSSITHTWILVYRVWPIPSQERVLIHRRRIPLRDLSPAGRWLTFNMKSHVEYAMQHRNTTIGFIVQASDGRGESLAIINLRNATEDVFVSECTMHLSTWSTWHLYLTSQRRILPTHTFTHPTGFFL